MNAHNSNSIQDALDILLHNYEKVGEKKIDMATQGWRFKFNVNIEPVDEFHSIDHYTRLAFARGATEVCTDPTTYYHDGNLMIDNMVALYVKGDMAGPSFDPNLPQTAIDEASSYLALPVELQREFLQKLHKDITSESNLGYLERLQKEDKSAAISLAYFADKMNGFEMETEATELEAVIHSYIPRFFMPDFSKS